MTKIRVSKIRVSEIRVTKIRVTKISVSKIRVSKIRVTKIRVTKIRVSNIRISSNHCKLHGAIFRLFEELGPICELLEKVSKIRVSEIKSHIGSLFQKYVSSSFMVKMRIDLGSFGLFWFILGWG